MPVTATVWPVRPTLARPLTPLAFEVSARVMSPASEPAVVAVTTTLPDLPARVFAGLVSASVPTVVVAVASRLSW